MLLRRLIPRVIWTSLLVMHGPILVSVVAATATQITVTGRCEVSEIASVLALLASMAFFGFGAAGVRVVPGGGTLRQLLIVVVAAGVFHHETVLEADTRGLMPLAMTTAVVVGAVASRRRWPQLRTMLAATFARPILGPPQGWLAPAPIAVARTSGGPTRRGRGPPCS